MLAIQESCKQNNITFLQKKSFRSDCWWDNTYESFCNFMKKANLFDFLSDDQLFEKFEYLQMLYNKVDKKTFVGNENESIQDVAEFSEKFFHHPTYKGHIQLAEIVIDHININNL